MNALIARPYGLDDFFPDIFRRMARPFGFESPIAGEIKIDVTENDKDYEVRAEIPGAKKEKEEKTKAGRLLVRETSYGAVSRGFSLGSEIDDKGVVAKLEDGILKLTLPKREGAKTRRIEVQ